MRRFRHESLLYAIAFLLALAVRLIKLGSLPLSDTEATLALQALGVAQGTHPILGSQPAYILLTSILFYCLGAGTNFLARLIPALVGSTLALVPALFAHRLRPRPAVILAFLFAVEPGLVSLSRQAGGGILAVAFPLLAWGLWENRRPAWAGVCAGLALLSGPFLWEGLLGLGLTWAISQALSLRRSAAESRPEGFRPDPGAWRTALWFALGSVVIGGTLFFLAPNGLSAWLSALPNYISGWYTPSGISAAMLLFSLVAYQPLAVILAILAMFRGWRQNSRRIMLLSLWMFVALFLALFYPARQVPDLAWMLIPLWALAALELARSLNVLPQERREVLGVVALTLVILAFIWINFMGLVQTGPTSPDAALRIWLLFGSIFLLVISILLVAVGWSLRSARFGAIWGLTFALGIYSISAMAAAGGLRAVPNAIEMWQSGGTLPEAKYLLMTVDQMSDWSATNKNSQPVTLAGVNSPALQWLLRNHTVTVIPAPDTNSAPPIVVTPEQNNPKLAANYRGQDFVWEQNPIWSQTSIFDWVNWLGFHQIPTNTQKVIVWVRSDLFIDSAKPKP